MATVHFDRVTHRYSGAPRPTVDDLELEIADGEFVVLVGSSGCGKSTSMRMLAGLAAVQHGRISIGERDVTELPAHDRDVAMVFGSYALYPNLTVAQNMGFALRDAGVNEADVQVRVDEAAKLLELEDLLERKPAKLSEGERQRVAMGRVIVRRPQVLCMDDPLADLNAGLRVSTWPQIVSLQKRLGTTTLYATHDQVEAMAVGDRVAVLREGRLQQIAAPRDLYDDPVNTFVAGFIGSPGMNLLDAPVHNDAAMLDDLRIPLPRSAKPGARVVLGIRPESWAVTSDSDGSVTITAERVEELGAESFLYGHGASEDWSSRTGKVVARVDRRFRAGLGAPLHLRPKPDEILFFDAETETRLR
ncbi:ABC transporter ATP-binding protein [Nocardia sp. NPDC050713]|uniref:ABC transporter ATP-binding protein n=1 Tax=Nocardia sp. NPDC050713 TaxID=3154511 RepID=UPI0033F6B27F